MKKNNYYITKILTATLLAVFCLTACSEKDTKTSNATLKDFKSADKDTDKTDKNETAEQKSSEKTGKKKSDTDKEEPDQELTEDIYRVDPGEVFPEMADWEFIFSSGAGGWETELFVKTDGTFTGSYYDLDMGDTGEGYSGGTRYICDFRGKFSDYIRAAGPNMYSLRLDELICRHEPGTEEIIDNVRVIYSEPYGFDVFDKQDKLDAPLVFMKPGAVTSAITQEEMSWLSPTHFGNYLGEDFEYIEDTPEYLPFAALINTVDSTAFFSENISDKNKVSLVNKVKISGLRNLMSNEEEDGTYYYVDEDPAENFRVINACFKTDRTYDDFRDGDKIANECLKRIYGKSAPSADDVYVQTPKTAASFMDYPNMIVNGEYSQYASWDPDSSDENLYAYGRFVYRGGYESDTSFLYAYVVEARNAPKNKNDIRVPDASFAHSYITSLTFAGMDADISSAGKGHGAEKVIRCEMKSPDRDCVLAREMIMVGMDDEELIKKYHLEDADFDDDYEIVYPDKEYKKYMLTGSDTPFYVMYPEDSFHKLYYAYDFDEYSGKNGNADEWTGLMALYLNDDNEVVYGYEIYTP